MRRARRNTQINVDTDMRITQNTHMKRTNTPLKTARLTKNLTLKQVCEQLSYNLDTGNLSRIERGEQATRPEMVAELARVLGISELEIIYPDRFDSSNQA